MISIDFSIRTPWIDDNFKLIFTKYGKFTENKSWEIQIDRDDTLISLYFRFTVRQDHAGIRFNIGLFGYSISTNLYDTRHWDYDNKCWKVYKGVNDV